MQTEQQIRATINLLEAYTRQDMDNLLTVPLSEVSALRAKIDSRNSTVAYLREVLGDTAIRSTDGRSNSGS